MSVFKIPLNRCQWNDKIETIVEYICIFIVTVYNQYIHYHNHMYYLGTFSNEVALNRYLLRKKRYPPSVFKKLTKYKNFLPEIKTISKNIFQGRIFFFFGVKV